MQALRDVVCLRLQLREVLHILGVVGLKELHGVHLVHWRNLIHINESALHLLVCQQFHVVLVVLINQHLLSVMYG